MTSRSATASLMAALAALPLSLAGCSDDAGTAESAGARPAASPSGWTPVPVDTDGFLPAGRLGMTANGRPDAPWAVLEVPERFSTIDGWVIFDEDPDGGGGVSYWTVSEVVRNPCGDPGPMDAGSTVEDLAAAFERQRLTRVTAPVPVTVDGYHGLSLELHAPRSTSFAACPDYNLWESDPAGARHLGSPGEFDRLWILDVEGEVLVLDVTGDSDVPRSALDGLARMVESVEFVPRS